MLANPALQKPPDDAATPPVARIKELVADPKLARMLPIRLARSSRLDRIVGGGESDLSTTIDNLRQITDNLRDLTEDTKRYPASVIFGGPPLPLERKRRCPAPFALRPRSSRWPRSRWPVAAA